MDLSAFIVVIVLMALFFGFIVWLAIHSRRANSQVIPSNDSETGLGREK
jgi:hypothetical protein